MNEYEFSVYDVTTEFFIIRLYGRQLSPSYHLTLARGEMDFNRFYRLDLRPCEQIHAACETDGYYGRPRSPHREHNARFSSASRE